MLKIRVMNISKKEMHKTLRKFKGTAWDQSPIFKKVYEEEFGQLGGQPYGTLVADYHFDHSPPDVELLGEMAKIAASAHAPLITGASPTLFQMDCWSELANPRDLTKIFQTPEYASWTIAAREPRTANMSVWRCRGSWAVCPMAPRPTRSRPLPLKRTPTGPITPNTAGSMRPMAWR